MRTNELFLEAIKEGFWYRDGKEIRKASPSIDLYKIGYICKEDVAYYGGKEMMFMYFLNPIRNPDLQLNLDNYGIIWSLNRDELIPEEE